MDPATITDPAPSADQTAPVATPQADANPAPSAPTPAADPAPAADTTKPADPAPGSDRPFLGNPPADPNAKPADTAAAPKTDDPNAPKPASEEDYLKAVQKDENVLGKDDNLTFDQTLVKSVIPVCQKHGIKPEVANEMANAFAKAQLDGAKAAFKDRADYFTKLNNEARAKYSDGDFQQINAGIDKWFKPGGIMNNVIRNSELGADPEFLALMHHLGASVREDTGKGTTDAGGAATGDPNGSDGISKIW